SETDGVHAAFGPVGPVHPVSVVAQDLYFEEATVAVSHPIHPKPANDPPLCEPVPAAKCTVAQVSPHRDCRRCIEEQVKRTRRPKGRTFPWTRSPTVRVCRQTIEVKIPVAPSTVASGQHTRACQR